MSIDSGLGGLNLKGSDDDEILFGTDADDTLKGEGGDDVVFGFLGADEISGGEGDDVLVGNQGDDTVLGEEGDDLIVWNNGDGSDDFDGGADTDKVQVNFNTNLTDNDLQNDDVAEYSSTPGVVEFARTELNDQNVFGLFNLEITNTEELETNFGGGDDTAKIKGTVLDEISLDLDGGDGTDLLDFSQNAEGIEVNLDAGTADTAKVDNFENVNGTEFEDNITGDRRANVISGLGGDDEIFGLGGDDTIIGNKGNDTVIAGGGDDLMVWNNGDGSDLFNGVRGEDTVQVNFNTDLTNNNLQNKDVAEFSVGSRGVEFARVELNDQSAVGLFQLDIRQTENLETNFGGGDDTAKLIGNIFDEIKLDLDGGDGIDLLDLSEVDEAVEVNLDAGTAETAEVDNFENVNGTEFDDNITGDRRANVISGNGGVDEIFGLGGDDTIIGNKGNDSVIAGGGDDLMVWNNGDGSDLFNGVRGEDTVQVNFNTDLINDDLQNKDVAEFSVGSRGVEFARVELNDQSAVGLFELDIRQTENLETNFGGGDDTAKLIGNVLDEIQLDLDGGDGTDLLDASGLDAAINVDLANGTAGSANINGFENVFGSDFNDILTGDDGDNILAGGNGGDIMSGGEGADTFVFRQGELGVDIILDFKVGTDRIEFQTDAGFTPNDVNDSLTQNGDDVELLIGERLIVIEDALVSDFSSDDFEIV